MTKNAYKQLARQLDTLPNGYPPTEDGVELKLLEWLFTPQEAGLAAQLRLTKESSTQIAERTGLDKKIARKLLKGMAKKGLITIGRIEGGLGFGIMPFAIGIYENQYDKIDEDLAQLFEEYYHQAFGEMISIEPYVHRVVPVGENIRVDMEVKPHENAAAIVENAKGWGVVKCLCRQQKNLIGEGCDHPLEVCMVISQVPGKLDNNPTIRSLTKEEALDTLQLAEEEGLVHSVSNNQKGLWYICNCCTCSCGILRGMADLGMANVIARSAFVLQVDEDLCSGCEVCVDRCQFGALSCDDVAYVNQTACVGCGLCVIVCSTEALKLQRRPEEEIKEPALTELDWMKDRAHTRGIDINEVM